MSDQIRDGALFDHGDPLFHSMSVKLRHYNGEVDSVGIEIDEPAASSIYRVPPSTRNVDPSAYEPEVVSIGPYHRQNPKLHAMEDHKWRYMHNLLLRRRRSDSADEVLKRCIDKVRRSEARVRRCYAVPNFCSMISNYDFVMALVLDGCFILELFLTSYHEDAAADDLIHAIPWMLTAIQRDLLKLENQIPFFILQDLFTAINFGTTMELQILIVCYLMQGPFQLLEESETSYICHLMINIEGGNKIYHLLHFYHMLLRPSSTSTTCDAGTPAGNNNNLLPRYCSSAMSMFFKKMKKNLMPHIQRRPSGVGRSPDHTTMIPCVGELCDAGITVSLRKPETKKKKKAASCAVLLDVAFKDGVLHVPRLTVVDSTNTIFRNLLALEQFCPGNSDHVTSYTLFLDCIVNSAKDVTILQQRGIINNMLGSEDEVALLINQLGKDVNISLDSHYLKGVFTEVNDYCESKWHKHRASCMRDYFGSPWTVISLFAAGALLLMTLIQVVFAILSYIKQ